MKLNWRCSCNKLKLGIEIFCLKIIVFVWSWKLLRRSLKCSILKVIGRFQFWRMILYRLKLLKINCRNILESWSKLMMIWKELSVL